MRHGISVAVVLALFVGSVSAAEPMTDYGAALKLTKLQGKPLVVLLEEPSSNKVQQVSFSEEKTVADDYIVCRVDVSTPMGKATAEAFKATQFPFTSIIDRTGAVQVFRQAGTFTTSELNVKLATYKNVTASDCADGSCSTGSCSTGSCDSGSCCTSSCGSGCGFSMPKCNFSFPKYCMPKCNFSMPKCFGGGCSSCN